MKKRYISLIIIAVILLILGGIGYFVANHHTVLFSFENANNYQIEIDTAPGKKVMTINSKNTSAWLWKGNYSYKVTNSMYDNSKHDFTVASVDKEIKINPNFSSSYLDSLLTDSVYSEIVSALQPDLSKVSTQYYSIQSLNLYSRGQWAAGTISYQQNPQDIPEIYRFVLEKTNNWKVVVRPTIAIYSGDYPQIPRDILNSLYTTSS